MSNWLHLALQPSIVRRAIMYAIVVGAILITINHGPAIIGGEVTGGRVAQMGLTVMVPYLVSTFSSVGAIRRMAREAHAPR